MEPSQPSQDATTTQPEKHETTISLPDQPNKRFDVLCILTKSNARAILSPEFLGQVRALNLDMEDLNFLHFPQIYELCAKSEYGPNNYEILNPEVLEQEHRLTAEEAEELNKQAKAARERGDFYDKVTPITKGENGLVLHTQSPAEYEACQAQKLKDAIESELRCLIDTLQEALKDDQTLASSKTHLFSALDTYSDYVEYYNIEIDPSVVETLKAIVAQSKGEKGPLPKDQGTDTATSTAEQPEEDTKTLDELLKDLVLRAADGYNKQYLAMKSEVDAEIVIVAERILAQSAQTPEAIPEGGTSKEKDPAVSASEKTEGKSKETSLVK